MRRVGMKMGRALLLAAVTCSVTPGGETLFAAAKGSAGPGWIDASASGPRAAGPLGSAPSYRRLATRQATSAREAAAEPVAETYPQWLARQRTARVEDLIRVVARFSGVTSDWGPPGTDPAYRVWTERTASELESRAIIRPGDDICPPDCELDRGTAALLFARVLDFDGGVTGSLFGLGRRSAYRDLVWAEIVPDGGEGYPVSGPELLAILQRARASQTNREGAR